MKKKVTGFSSNVRICFLFFFLALYDCKLNIFGFSFIIYSQVNLNMKCQKWPLKSREQPKMKSLNVLLCPTNSSKPKNI